MLPKRNRVNKKEVDEIFKSGSFVNSPNLTFKFLLKKGIIGPKVSFISPKSISKKAVIRNKLRRIGYNILKKYKKDFPSELIGVFVFRKYQDDVSIIENEIKTIFSKIN
jgi:ribonuclease P protein component